MTRASIHPGWRRSKAAAATTNGGAILWVALGLTTLGAVGTAVVLSSGGDAAGKPTLDAAGYEWNANSGLKITDEGRAMQFAREAGNRFPGADSPGKLKFTPSVRGAFSVALLIDRDLSLGWIFERIGVLGTGNTDIDNFTAGDRGFLYRLLRAWISGAAASGKLPPGGPAWWPTPESLVQKLRTRMLASGVPGDELPEGLS